jgi:hypothetical protein
MSKMHRRLALKLHDWLSFAAVRDDIRQRLQDFALEFA